jgi:ABC-type multidrug transport system ATPase subunit
MALTAWENLLFAGRMWGIDKPEKHAADCLSLVGLVDHVGQTAAQLSRGMRQRLAIARALIHDPAMIFLDEPFTSLDGKGRKWLTEFLCELRKRKRSILLATHEFGFGNGFVDRFVHLQPDGLREVVSGGYVSRP